jgi:hypothetical protein
MRKRISKRKLVAKATTEWVINLDTKQKTLVPYVRIFGDWIRFSESDLPRYKDFKIEWR